jgi:hypothetical protein
MNEKFKVGDIVGIRLDSGDFLITKISHEFTTLGSGRCVVWTKGRITCVDADRVHSLIHERSLTTNDRNSFERTLLAPILKELDLRIGRAGQKFNIPGADILELCVKSIRALKASIARQKKAIMMLRERREDDAQAVLSFLNVMAATRKKGDNHERT